MKVSELTRVLRRAKNETADVPFAERRVMIKHWALRQRRRAQNQALRIYHDDELTSRAI